LPKNETRLNIRLIRASLRIAQCRNESSARAQSRPGERFWMASGVCFAG
jgi:hypothetical protein